MALVPAQLVLNSDFGVLNIVKSLADDSSQFLVPNVLSVVSGSNGQFSFQSSGGAEFTGSIVLTSTHDLSNGNYSFNTLGASISSIQSDISALQSQMSNIITVLNNAFALDL